MGRFLIILLISFLSAAYGSNENSLLCADGLKRISPSELCDHSPDCADASDEFNFKLCKILTYHRGMCSGNDAVRCKSQYGEHRYLNEQCIDILTACSLGTKCLSSESFPLCSVS
ncbi:UNVERIFIED_CONTAM: hypothetical protein RMT77_000409 [Armadillidium vulgare]